MFLFRWRPVTSTYVSTYTGGIKTHKICLVSCDTKWLNTSWFIPACERSPALSNINLRRRNQAVNIFTVKATMIQRFIELLSMKIPRDFSQSAIVRLHHSYYVVAGGKRIRGSLSKWIKQMIKTNTKKRTETNFFL